MIWQIPVVSPLQEEDSSALSSPSLTSDSILVDTELNKLHPPYSLTCSKWKEYNFFCNYHSHKKYSFKNLFVKMNKVWKTMPGRVKQVPQDSTEWDRTNTGHSTDKHLHVWSRDKLLFWTPLVISYKKYINWKLFMRFH